MDISDFLRAIPASPDLTAKEAAYAGPVGKAADTRAYQRLADTVFTDMQGVNYRSTSDTGPAPGRPQLVAPRVPVKGGDPEAEDQFTLLMANLIALLGSVEIESLKSRMQMLKMAANAAAAGNLELSEKYLAAAAALEGAQAEVHAAKTNLEGAKAALSSAQAQLQQAEQTLANTPRDSPEYAKALIARDMAQLKVKGAAQGFEKAGKAARAAIDSMTQATKNVEALATQIEEQIDKPNTAVIEGMKQQLNAAAMQVALIMGLAELMGKSAETKLENEVELSRDMLAKRQAYLDKKSEEYQQQVAKAEASSKTMGCIGKILGAVLIVASIVGAAFTGGASLVLAGVGLALTVGDQIGKAITGVSIMEKAMQPLMDKVLGPMIQAIGKAIGDVLKKMGVDAQTAEMAGNILGAIVGAVAMVAALVVVVAVGKGAGARVASSSLGKMLGKMASKMAPDMLKQASRSLSKSVTSGLANMRTSIGLKSDANSLAMYGNRLGAGVAAIEAGGVTVESAMGVKSGMHQKKAAEQLADVQVTMAIQETMKAYSEKMVENFGEITKSTDQVLKTALGIQDNTNSTALVMARNI